MIDCRKPSTLTFSYWNMLPLVNIDPETPSITSGNNSGIMVETLQRLIGKCCAAGTRLVATRAAENPRDLEESSASETFVFPVRKSMLRLQTYVPYNEQFLPILESPGIAYITANIQPNAGTSLLDLLSAMWQVFFLIILACCFSGILIWILDHQWNHQDFSRNAMKGCGEGIWWAFVTATTVGYGDVKPRFIIGRTFGVLWILLGVGLMAVFTATVTASMSLDTANTVNTPYGARVAVLNGTEEMHIAITQGAYIHVYNDLRSLVWALDDTSNSSQTLMLDYIQKFPIVDSLSRLDAKVTKEQDFPSMYGILVRNMPSDVTNCMGKLSESMRFEAFVHMNELRSTRKWENSWTATERFKQFVSFNPLLLVYGYVALIILVLMMVAYEFIRKKIQRKQSFTIKENHSDAKPHPT